MVGLAIQTTNKPLPQQSGIEVVEGGVQIRDTNASLQKINAAASSWPRVIEWEGDTHFFRSAQSSLYMKTIQQCAWGIKITHRHKKHAGGQSGWSSPRCLFN